MFLDLKLLKLQLDEYGELLDSNDWLTERQVFNNFLKNKAELLKGILLLNYPNEISNESIFVRTEVVFRDFRADSIIYNPYRGSKRLCLIEFEGAEPDSVFVRPSDSSGYKFSPKLIKGLTQLIDWDSCISSIEPITNDWLRFTGKDNNQPLALSYILIVGRENLIETQTESLSLELRRRLNYLRNKIILGNEFVIIMSYDEIYYKIMNLLDLYNLTP